jgi:tRNA pseudouridine38-40 synthase
MAEPKLWLLYLPIHGTQRLRLKTPAYALWVWYRGTGFRGYQRQVTGPTVQQVMEEALKQAGVERTLVAAGRTDLGVHARMQVVGFRAPHFDVGKFQTYIDRLAADLGVCAIRRAPDKFHPQFSAVAKEYRYRLCLDPDRTNPFAWNPPRAPRISQLNALLARCVGTRDFIAFHEKSSARKPRTVEKAECVLRDDGLYDVRIKGSGFGRYQIRYLVGSAVLVASGELDEALFVNALEKGEAFAGHKAPAHGLTLWEVSYPAPADPFVEDREGQRSVPRELPFV